MTYEFIYADGGVEHRAFDTLNGAINYASENGAKINSWSERR